MIKALIKYLGKKRGYFRPPSDLSDKWDWLHRGATHDQRIIMRWGLAKTPDDAQRLMDKRGLKAWEIIDQLPRPKKRNIRERFIMLIRRIDGHDPRNPYQDRDDNDKFDYTYKFK